MATSQNGYTANDRGLIGTYTVPGSTRKLALRMGDVSVVLLDLAAWFHATIAPIDEGVLDDWGYAERTIRGSATTLSNHASGTAIDLDATRHPLGVHGTWTPEQKTLIHARLDLYDGVIRWGEDYDDPTRGGVPGSRIDGMHFEINAGAAAVCRVADRIRSGTLAPPAVGPALPPDEPTKDEPMSPIDIRIAPDGSFRGTVICEAGSTSAVVAQAWLIFGVTWGHADVIVSFLDVNGIVMPPGPTPGQVRATVANNLRLVADVPDGCVMATVEGRLSPNAIPAAAVMARPK